MLIGKMSDIKTFDITNDKDDSIGNFIICYFDSQVVKK